jgi:hypothetical protein
MEIEKSRVLLTNSTSFGELLFFKGLFQKSRQEGPNYQMDYWNSTAKDTLEDSRRHEKAVGESGTLEASRGGQAAPGPQANRPLAMGPTCHLLRAFFTDLEDQS